MHSWRVLILPYIEQQILYDAYRFDEPWDGPNNRKLAPSMPDLFCCPSDPNARELGFTNYLAVIGPDTAWPGTTPRKISEIKDGSSNTILLIEVAGSGVNWMEPRDLHVLQMKPQLNAKHGQGPSAHHTVVNAVLVDGSVHSLSPELEVDTLRAMLTVDGGERIPQDAWEH